MNIFECKYCGSEFTPKRKDTQYCSSKCGSKFRSYKFRLENRAGHLACAKRANEKRRSKPFGRYTDQKVGARGRGLPFTLTYDEWWSLWEPYWETRGVGGHVMCRTNDLGGYELGNVRIDTHTNNNIEACKSGGRSREVKCI